MRHFLSLLLVAPLTLTGCAALLIQPHDSTATKAAKVTGRVPLAVATFGIAELAYSCARGSWPADPATAAQQAKDETRGTPAVLDECVNKIGEANSTGWNSTGFNWQTFPSIDTTHHQKGHTHHHGHGC